MKLRVQGPDALSFLERVCANRIDRPVGTVVYTAMLTPARRDPLRPHGDAPRRGRLHGRDRRRLGHARPRVAPRAGARRRAGADLRRLEPLVRASGLWGPRARDILGGRHRRRRLERRDPVHDRRARSRSARCRCSRSGSATSGELGWELYGPIEMGAARLGRCCGRPAATHGLIAAGPRRVRLAPPGEGLPPLGPGHPHRVRPARRRASGSPSGGTRTSRAGRRSSAIRERGSREAAGPR